MWKDKLLTFFTLALFLVGCGTIGSILYSSYFFKEKLDSLGQLSCVIEQQMSVMADSDLAGIVEKGSPIKIYLGHYIQSKYTPPLKTYEISRGGKLAEDEYIILSNIPPRNV